MKKIFGNTDNEEYVIKEAEGVVHVANSKYTQDLFFVAPFYHREIPEEMEKLIVVDIDIEFRVDILELFEYFSRFKQSELIAIANDMSPHYYNMLKFYRERNPGHRDGKKFCF